ncbi:hypothetical protein HK405_013632, partial [Cladochytrium tenue]
EIAVAAADGELDVAAGLAALLRASLASHDLHRLLWRHYDGDEGTLVAIYKARIMAAGLQAEAVRRPWVRRPSYWPAGEEDLVAAVFMWADVLAPGEFLAVLRLLVYGRRGGGGGMRAEVVAALTPERFPFALETLLRRLPAGERVAGAAVQLLLDAGFSVSSGLMVSSTPGELELSNAWIAMEGFAPCSVVQQLADRVPGAVVGMVASGTVCKDGNHDALRLHILPALAAALPENRLRSTLQRLAMAAVLFGSLKNLHLILSCEPTALVPDLLKTAMQSAFPHITSYLLLHHGCQLPPDFEGVSPLMTAMYPLIAEWALLLEVAEWEKTRATIGVLQREKSFDCPEAKVARWLWQRETRCMQDEVVSLAEEVTSGAEKSRADLVVMALLVRLGVGAAAAALTVRAWSWNEFQEALATAEQDVRAEERTQDLATMLAAGVEVDGELVGGSGSTALNFLFGWGYRADLVHWRALAALLGLDEAEVRLAVAAAGLDDEEEVPQPQPLPLVPRFIRPSWRRADAAGRSQADIAAAPLYRALGEEGDVVAARLLLRAGAEPSGLVLLRSGRRSALQEAVRRRHRAAATFIVGRPELLSVCVAHADPAVVEAFRPAVAAA